MVENGYDEPSPSATVPNPQLKENHKKDSKALFYLQYDIDDGIFPHISSANSAHEAQITL